MCHCELERVCMYVANMYVISEEWVSNKYVAFGAVQPTKFDSLRNAWWVFQGGESHMLDSASCELHVASWRRPDLVGPNLGAPDIIRWIQELSTSFDTKSQKPLTCLPAWMVSLGNCRHAVDSSRFKELTSKVLCKHCDSRQILT